jgi:hypothetical protein
MNYLVIYPGRFHPFHRGHKASYDYLTKKYGEGSVYIATSAVQDPLTSPFSYSDKVKMMTKLGIPSGHVVQVKNPYQAQEIVNGLGDEEQANTVLIFAVSEKDMLEGSARFRFGTKKNGEPSYLQPMPADGKRLKPLTKHAYVSVTPTVNFKVRGQDADSASAIRKMYREGNDADRLQIITDLYGTPDPELKAIFDERLGVNKPQDAVIYGQEKIFAGDAPVNAMHEGRLLKLQENIQFMRKKLQALREKQDYIDEHRTRKK